jgi:formate dehydrogenase maturation protein FdhE
VGLFKQKQPEVIDLREASRPPKRILFEFGFPTSCPSCGERGYLDHIDPFKRIQYEHCPVCFTKWERTESDVAALNEINA